MGLLFWVHCPTLGRHPGTRSQGCPQPLSCSPNPARCLLKANKGEHHWGVAPPQAFGLGPMLYTVCPVGLACCSGFTQCPGALATSNQKCQSGHQTSAGLRESVPLGHPSSLPFWSKAPPLRVSTQCCTSSCVRSSLPSPQGYAWDPTESSPKARVGSLEAGQASVMHCGNIAWVPPEHAMQLQCTTAARQDAAGPPRVCAREGVGSTLRLACKVWGGRARCLEQMQSRIWDSGVDGRCLPPGLKREPTWANRLHFGGRAACLGAGSWAASWARSAQGRSECSYPPELGTSRRGQICPHSRG